MPGICIVRIVLTVYHTKRSYDSDTWDHNPLVQTVTAPPRFLQDADAWKGAYLVPLAQRGTPPTVADDAKLQRSLWEFTDNVVKGTMGNDYSTVYSAVFDGGGYPPPPSRLRAADRTSRFHRNKHNVRAMRPCRRASALSSLSNR